MRRAAVVVAAVALGLAGCGDNSKVEQALADYYAPADVLVVENSCSQRGETESGNEHWVCVVQGPGTEFDDGPTDEVDISWNGSKILQVER